MTIRNLERTTPRTGSKLRTKLMVSLMLTLFVTPSTRADSSGILNLNPNPSGYTSYSPKEQKHLANYIKQCKLDKKDLADTREAYDSCRDKVAGKLFWWQTPYGAISLGLGAFALGVVLAQ